MWILSKTSRFLPQLTSSSVRLGSQGGPIQATISRRWKTVQVPEAEIHVVGRSAAAQANKGKIYDKKPFKIHLIKGKEYFWCACGQSKTQPICDATHKNPHYKITMRPVRFIAPETKDYWFCNCKQTSKRPFCDGTHRREDIQAAIKS